MTTPQPYPPSDDQTAYNAGAIQLIRRQLRYLFGELSPETEQRLAQADFQQLEAWAESLLQADQLDQVLNNSNLTCFRRFLEVDNKETGIHVRLRRIGDQRYQSLVRHSLSIDPDYAFWFHLTRHSSGKENSLDNLARFYAAFRQTYGESGSGYDHWKGAFNFAFEVQVLKRGEMIPYTLNVLNFRSGVEFRYYKVIDLKDQSLDRTIIHRPFAEEFSGAQMNVVSSYLCGFAEGYWQTTRHQTGEREFLKWVDSNLILFGYREAEYFQEDFEEDDAFQTAKAIIQGSQPSAFV